MFVELALMCAVAWTNNEEIERGNTAYRAALYVQMTEGHHSYDSAVQSVGTNFMRMSELASIDELGDDLDECARFEPTIIEKAQEIPL
jgi:hypothetical protein